MAARSRKHDDHDIDTDDWGMYPLPYSHPPDSSLSSSNTIGFYLRKYRAAILTVTIILLFFFYRRSSGDVHAELPPPPPAPPVTNDWSRFAYVQYATDVHSLCNAYMVFESLHRLGSKAERVLLFPKEWNAETEDEADRSSQLLARANRLYNVRLYPMEVLGLDGVVPPGTLEEPSSWETGVTKFRAFELDDFDRVLYFDSDILLRQHVDELFLLPSAPIAMLRRYWSDVHHTEWPLSGALMLIEPNSAELDGLWERLQDWRLVPERADDKTYDDDLLDDRFRSSALVLPHRPYFLQTFEFRKRSHEAYLGSFHGPVDLAKWDAHAELEKAKIVHFNDWPLPKPWIMWPSEGLEELQPDCPRNVETCPNRDVWLGLYEEFRSRRENLCRIMSVPAHEDWREWKKLVGAL